MRDAILTCARRIAVLSQLNLPCTGNQKVEKKELGLIGLSRLKTDMLQSIGNSPGESCVESVLMCAKKSTPVGLTA